MDHARALLQVVADRVLPWPDVAALASLKVGWDAGNGAAGPVLEKLIERLPGVIDVHIGPPIAVVGMKPEELNRHVEAWIEQEMPRLGQL